MRVEEIVPRILPIGARVLYTHRAASAKRAVSTSYDDGFDGRARRTPEAYGLLDRRDYGREDPADGAELRPPRRQHFDRVFELDRWVWVWPAEGEGYVTGLLFRQEGRWDDVVETGELGEPIGGQRTLDATEAWPLYQVKRAITSAPILVPVWATCAGTLVRGELARREDFLAEVERLGR